MPALRSRLPIWLPLTLLAAVPLALVWATLAYHTAHLEGQGIDLIHHAVLVHEVARAEGPDAGVLVDLAHYPMTAHRLAALVLPLCGDPVLAMRATAWMAILWTFALQLALLRRFLSWPAALLALGGVQLLCVNLKVGTLNYILWEGQYNYSRLVAATCFWGTLYFLTLTPTWYSGGVALSLAALAFLCHLAAGVPAFLMLIAYGACLATERHNWRELALPVLAVATLGLLLVTSGAWEYMASNAAEDGWLPVRVPWVLALWGVVAAFVVLRWVARLQTPSAARTVTFERVLGAGLLAAGALQALLALRCGLGQAAPYAVKSLFFLTVPLALFLLAFWVSRLRPLALPPRAGVAAGVGLLLLQGVVIAGGDLGLRPAITSAKDTAGRRTRTIPAPAALPVCVERILAHMEQPDGVLYHDPLQPHGSYYLNLVALRHDRATALAALAEARHRDLRGMLALPGVREVLVPRSTAGALAGGPRLTGSRFWHYHAEPRGRATAEAEEPR